MIKAGTTSVVNAYYGRQHPSAMYSGNYLIYPLRQVKTTTVTITAANLLAANNNVETYPPKSTLQTSDANLWIRAERSNNTNNAIALYTDIRRNANSWFVFVAVPPYKVLHVKMYYNDGYPIQPPTSDPNYNSTDNTYTMFFDRVQEAVIQGGDVENQVRFTKIEVTYTNQEFLIEGKFDTSATPVINYNSNNALTVKTLDDLYYVTSIPSAATSIKIPSSSKIKSINKFKFAPTSMSTAFENCTDLTSADFSLLDMSNCTHMGWMFKNTGFSTLTLNFDTSSVTNMQSAFNYMANLVEIDLSAFDTSSVTTMRTMFQNDSNLEIVNLSGFDMSSVTDYGYMFQNCSKLWSLILNDVSNDTFNKITNYATSYLPKTVIIDRDGYSYFYDSSQDAWVLN